MISRIYSSFSVFFYALCIFCISATSSHAQFKVVGYLVNWSGFLSGANAVDYTKVTHINVAFINPDADGNLGPVDNLTTVAGIVHTNNSKILASIGGANGNKPNWSAVMATPTSRTAFVTKLTELVSTHNLDGIDVDIEGDLLDGTTITNAQYASFIEELEIALHGQNKLMTAALGTWFASRISNATLQKFDWINAMAYDAYGTWTGPGQHSSYNLAVNDLNFWNSRGVDKDHLVLGVPSYGYRWTTTTSAGSSSIGYNSLVSIYPRAANQDSITPSAGQAIYHNGIPTIKDKTALAITNASGVMMWTLQFDFATSNPASLIRAIDEVIQATISNDVPTVSITAPTNSSSYTEGDTITITANATDTDGSIETVTFYSALGAAINTLGDDLTAPYTKQWIVEGPGTYNVYAKAKDNAFATGTSSNVSVTIAAPSQARSFGGPYAIPGRIEAENFDIGKDLGYYDLTVANQGNAYRTTTVDIEANTDGGAGYNVGWVQAGEWLSYKVNVAATGTYELKARVATTTAGKYFHIEMNGINVSGNITVPNTGGWATFQTVTIPNVSLTQGMQAMKLVFDTGDFNINYVTFTSSAVTGISDADASGNLSAVVSPNPFSHQAQLQLNLKNGGQTKITINNMMGASPITIADQYFAPGDHRVEIGELNIPAGIYLCTITNGDHTKAVKIIKE